MQRFPSRGTSGIGATMCIPPNDGKVHAGKPTLKGDSSIQPCNAIKQIGGLHSLAVFLKVRARSLPAKIIDRIKNGHIQSQSRKSPKQQGVVPCVE